MNRTLAAYVRRRVGSQILLMLLGITALMQLLELLDVTPDILSHGHGVRALMYYAMLRTPAEVVLALPLAVLLGSMKALSEMARALEITAMRSAGISLMRLLGHLLPMLLLFALAHFALSEQVLPRAETELKRWWAASALSETEPSRLWARTSSGPVSIDSISPDGSRLHALRLYERSAEGLLTLRLSAAEARWTGQAWHMTDVTELRVRADGISRVVDASREWQTNLRPEDVLRLDVSRPYLSSTMLAEIVSGTRAGSQPRSYYLTVLYRSFTAPLAVIVMLLLAMPTASSMSRTGGGLQKLLALALGLGFLLCDGIVVALGTSGALPPLAMAVAAPTLFAAIGMLQIHASEKV